MTGILALDIATTTGAAFARPGEAPVWCHKKFDNPLQFHDWLAALIRQHAPAWLIFESPYTRPPIRDAVIRKLYGMLMVAELTAAQHGVKTREVDTASVTKHFTGMARWGSRGEKKAATLRCCERHGWAPVTEDEADALAVLVYAEALIDPVAASKRGIGQFIFTAPILKRGAARYR